MIKDSFDSDGKISRGYLEYMAETWINIDVEMEVTDAIVDYELYPLEMIPRSPIFHTFLAMVLAALFYGDSH